MNKSFDKPKKTATRYDTNNYSSYLMNISLSTAISQKKASSNLDHNRSPFFGVGSNEHFGMSSCVLLSHRTEMASLKDVQVEKNRRTRKDQRFRTSKTHSCRGKEQDKAELEELLMYELEVDFKRARTFIQREENWD